jgi:hypothetical protein
MKKNLLLSFVVLISISLINAQQLENPSFEDWEDAGTVEEEPVNWSSLKTSDNTLVNSKAPVVWARSDDAHSGLSSLMLTNIGTLGIVATGIMTNGRVHGSFTTEEGYVFTDREDDRWHTVFNHRPDSLVGWYKYFPEPGDSCVVTSVLHKRDGTLPENETADNMVAKAEFKSNGETVDEWTRFSVPFVYFKDSIPDYIMITLNSGNKLNSVDGSTAYYDDLELIYEGGSSIDEGVVETNAIYVYDNSIRLDKMADGELKGSVLKVYDLNGQKLLEREVTSKSIALNNQFRNSNIYVVVLNTKDKLYTRKVIIN